MPAGGRPTVRSRRLGTALRRYRHAAKFDQLQAAEVIASSQARISRLESGNVTARVIEVRLLLDAYGVKDPTVCAKLEALAKPSLRRGWWAEHAPYLRPDYLDHIALENDASHIRQWQPTLIPGLLQTPAYTRAVIEGGPTQLGADKAARLMEVRRRRQEQVLESDTRYDVVIWEAVIKYPLVGADIHREQLSALLKSGERDGVSVQVLPFSVGALAAATSAFSAFSFDSEPEVEAVTMDDLMNTSVIESSTDLATFASMHELLRSTALAPDASAKLIRETLQRI